MLHSQPPPGYDYGDYAGITLLMCSLALSAASSSGIGLQPWGISQEFRGGTLTDSSLFRLYS